MVRELAAAGADLVVSSRKAENCDDIAEEIRAMGRRALPIGCHVGRWDECRQLVESTVNEFGRVDVLINNAGSIADPSEIVGTALWMAGDASSYLNGQCVTVDGGGS